MEEIKKTIKELNDTINWYHKRGGLLPCDWNDYAQPKINKLMELVRLEEKNGRTKKE